MNLRVLFLFLFFSESNIFEFLLSVKVELSFDSMLKEMLSSLGI